MHSLLRRCLRLFCPPARRLPRSAILRIFATLVPSLFASATPVYALPHADRIIVHKKEHTLELMHNGNVLKTYKIALGRKSGKAARGGPAHPRGRIHHLPPECAELVSSIAPHFLSECGGPQAGPKARGFAGWRHLHSWPAKRIWVHRSCAPST